MIKLSFILIFFCWQMGASSLKAIEGLLPPSYGNPVYPDNPANRLTSQQKMLVSEAFKKIASRFQQNHSICSGRWECLKADLDTLRGFINSNSYHPARPFMEDIYKIIHHDSQRHKFVSQLTVFQNLSRQRQQEYIEGLRISPLRRQNVKTLWGTSWITAPAHYNQDDIFTLLLQEIEHQHRNCETYAHCINRDLILSENLYKRLAITDPARPALLKLTDTLKRLSRREVFNTSLYLKLYNPLSPQWNDILTKRRASQIAGYDDGKWQRVRGKGRPVQWLPARVTNGKVIS